MGGGGQRGDESRFFRYKRPKRPFGSAQKASISVLAEKSCSIIGNGRGAGLHLYAVAVSCVVKSC